MTTTLIVTPPFRPDTVTDEMAADFLMAPPGSLDAADLTALAAHYRRLLVDGDIAAALAADAVLPDHCRPLPPRRPSPPPAGQSRHGVTTLTGLGAIGARAKYALWSGDAAPPPAAGPGEHVLIHLAVPADCRWAAAALDGAARAGIAAVVARAPGVEWPAEEIAGGALARAAAAARLVVAATPEILHMAMVFGRPALRVVQPGIVADDFRDIPPGLALPLATAATLAERMAGIIGAATPVPDRAAYLRHFGHGAATVAAELADGVEALRWQAPVTIDPPPPAAPDRRLGVAIFGGNPAGAYSGGRYHAWVMAESLAAQGHDVHVVTNVEPIFSADFRPSPGHRRVRLVITTDYAVHGLIPPPDVVVIIPSMGGSHRFYDNAVAFAQAGGARLCLVNFESANWFNRLSPVWRDPMAWADWARVAEHCAVILSSAEEGRRHAVPFYACDAEHAVAPPAINTLAADMAPDTARERRIVAITRRALAEHKGGDRLAQAMCEAMRGHTLVLLSGEDAPEPERMAPLREAADRHGIAIEVLCRLTDVEKFRQIKRAALVLFPSYFEGFGYPPVEATYCGTPCVAFDLPVLREVCGNTTLFLAPPGDWQALRQRVAEALAASGRPDPQARQRIADDYSLEALGRRLYRIFSAALRRPPTPRAFQPMVGHGAFVARWRPPAEPTRPLAAGGITLTEACMDQGGLVTVHGLLAPLAPPVGIALIRDGREWAFAPPTPRSRPDTAPAFVLRAITDDAAPDGWELRLDHADGRVERLALGLRRLGLDPCDGNDGWRPLLAVDRAGYDVSSGHFAGYGWCFGARPGDRLRLGHNGRIIGWAEMNIRRDGIFHATPTSTRMVGWSVSAAIAPPEGDDDVIAAELVAADGTVRASRCFALPPGAAPPLVELAGTRPGRRDGRPVAVVCHVPLVPAVQGNRVVIAQMLDWLARRGHPVFLVLQVPWPVVAADLAAYAGLCDRLWVADPRVQPTFRPRVNDSDIVNVNVTRCLHDIHARFGLVAVVAQYVHMASCLRYLPREVRRYVQTHDVLHRIRAELAARPDRSGQNFRICGPAEESALLCCADVVIAIQDHERGLLEPLAAGRKVITVGLAGFSLGQPLPHSDADCATIMLTASDNPLNRDGLDRFLSRCWPTIRAAVPRARLRVAGDVVPTVTPLPDGVDLLGRVGDLTAEFAACAVVVNPVPGGTGLKIKSVEAIARGRALVSWPAGVEGIAPCGLSCWRVAGDDAEFAAQAIALLTRPAARRQAEIDARTYAGTYLTAEFVYRELEDDLRQWERRDAEDTP